MRYGVNFFWIKVKIDVCKLLIFVCNWLVMFNWLISMFVVFLIIILRCCRLRKYVLESVLIVLKLFEILNWRLFIFLFVVVIYEVICLLCFWRVLIMLLDVWVKVLMWEVKMLTLFIVVVLKRFLESDFIKGSNERVFFFDWFLWKGIIDLRNLRVLLIWL